MPEETIKAKLKDLNVNKYVVPYVPTALSSDAIGLQDGLGLSKPDQVTILISQDGTLSVSDSVSPDGNKATIQVRRDTAANFAAEDPVLKAGEWAYVTDLQKVKIGDGETHFTELDYLQTDLSITGSGDIVVTTPEENHYVISSNLVVTGGNDITATKEGNTITITSNVDVTNGSGITVSKQGSTYTVEADNTVLRDTDMTGDGVIKVALDGKQNKLINGENIELTDTVGSDPVDNTVSLYRFDRIYKTGGFSTVPSASIAYTLQTYPDEYDGEGFGVFNKEAVYVYLGNVVKSFNLYQGDFTCEAFMKNIDVWTSQGKGIKDDWTTLQIGSDSYNYTLDLGVQNGEGVVRAGYKNGATSIYVGTMAVSTFQEHHLAIVRKEGVVTFYVDGAVMTLSSVDPIPNISFSTNYGNIQFNMCTRVHGFRISNVARYEEAFTPDESSYYKDGSSARTVISALVDTSKCATKAEVDAFKAEVHSGYPTKSDLQSGLNTKQNTLTAGANITITGNTISAKDTTYTAGAHVYINDAGVISADGPEQDIPQNVYTKDSLVSGTSVAIVPHANKFVVGANDESVYHFDKFETQADLWEDAIHGYTLTLTEDMTSRMADVDSKFGRGSVDITPSATRYIPLNENSVLRNADFTVQEATIDAWVKGQFGAIGLGVQNLYSVINSNNFMVYYYDAGNVLRTTSVTRYVSDIETKWHHILMQNSITRSAVEFYLDGTKLITLPHSNLSATYFNFNNLNFFGSSTEANVVRHVDELHIATIAKYNTDTFAEHDEPYELEENSGKMQVNAVNLVTQSDFASALSTKQDAGDYATNSALQSGLDTKQPTLTAGEYITINNNVIDVDSAHLIGTAYNKENFKPETNSVTGVQVEFNQPGAKFVIDEDTVDAFHFDEDDVANVASVKNVCSFSKSGTWAMVEGAEHFNNAVCTSIGQGSQITIGNITNLFGGQKSWTIDFKLSIGTNTETYARTMVSIPLAGNNTLSLYFTKELVYFGGNTYYHNMCDGQWHHYAVVYDYVTKKATLFIDGINRLIYTQETVSSSSQTVVTFKFGQDYYYDVDNGKLDEVRITKKALWDGYSFAVPAAPYTDHLDSQIVEVSASIDPEIVATKEYADTKMDRFSPGANLQMTEVMGTKVLNVTLDPTTLATKSELAAKQDQLTAGDNVTIETDAQTGNLVISADLGGSTNFVSKDDIVTTIDAQSTDDQVPSAKAIYTILNDIETQLSDI